MDEKKALRNNTISLLIIQIMNYVIPLITLPYLSRIFSVDKFGLIFYAQAVIDYFMRFILFGFELSGVRTVSINRDNHEKINKIFNAIFNAQLILFVISFFLLVLLVFFTPKYRSDFPIFLLVFFPLFGMVLSSTWFYQGMEKMKFITYLNIIGQTLGVICTFIFVKKPDDYFLWLGLGIFISLITGFISIYFIKKYFNIKYEIAPLKDIWESLKDSSQYFLTRLSVFLYRQFNVVVLGIFATSTSVAFYTAADKIFMAALGVFFNFINAFFPYMSQKKDVKFFKKTLKYISILTIICTVFTFVLAKPLIILIYSDKYVQAIEILKVFSFLYFFGALIPLLGYSFLGAFGYIKETNSCYILGGVYNVICLLVLIILNKVNIYTVAGVASSTYIVMFLHRLYYVHKYKLLKINPINNQ